MAFESPWERVSLSLIDGIAQFARLSLGFSPLSRVRFEDGSVVSVRRFGSIVEIRITPCSSIYPAQSEALKVLELEFPDPTLQDFVVTKRGNLRVGHYKNLGCSSEELQTIARKINEASRVLELDSGLKLVEEVIIPERDCSEAASNNVKTIIFSKSLASVLAESTEIMSE
jgi:hypothetical protein